MRPSCRGPLAFLVGTFACLLATGVQGQALRPAIDESKAVLYGPPSGDISNIAIARTNSSVMYASGAAGGVFHSGDRGRSWSRRSRGLPDLNVLSIYIHPQIPGTVWVGMQSGGIAKSTDEGKTWVPKNTGLPNFGGFYQPIYDISGSVQDPLLLIAASSGVQRSTNGGESWVLAGLSARALKEVEVAPTDSSVIYAADAFAAFRSPNGGLSWTGIFTSTLTRTFGSLSVDPVNPNTVYLGGTALSKTLNAGANWTTVHACPDSPAVTDVVIDPNNTNRIFAACGSHATAVRESVDAGTNWVNAGSLPYRPRGLGLANDLVYVASDEGTFVSDTAVRTWVLSSKGQHAGSVPRVALAGKDAVFVDGPEGRRVNLQTLADAAALPKRFAVLPSDIAFTPILHVVPPGPTAGPGDFPMTFVASGSKVYFSPPGPTVQPWQPASGGIPADFNIQAIHSTSADETVLHMAGGYSNASNNSPNVFTLDTKQPAKEWKPLPTRAPSFVLEVYRSPHNPDFFYSASFSGIFKTLDGGKTWSAISGLPEGTPVYGLIVDPANDNIIWVNVGFTIKRSTDGGKTFGEPVRPEGFKDLVSLTVDPVNPHVMLAGSTSGGLFRSNDAGATWVRSTLQVDDVKVFDIDMSADGAFVGGTSSGVFAIAPPILTPPAVPPTIVVHPQSLLINTASDAIYTCKATGTEPIAYEWELLDSKGFKRTYGKSANVENGTATLTGAFNKDSPTYSTIRCKATNVAGSAVSKPADLVLFDKLLDQAFASVAVRKGASLTTAWAKATATATTPPQPVTVRAGSKGHPWTASASQPWIRITGGSGDGIGQFLIGVDPALAPASGTATGLVTVTESSFPYTQTLTVNLNVVNTPAPPVGSFDTPADGSAGLSGAIAVTGWALDDVGVNRVEIWRNCVDSIDRPAGACASIGTSPPNFVFVGHANFVAGARPDVETANTSVPQANRAGWGYLMLTIALPHIPTGQPQGGQGPFTLYAYAVDVEGQYSSLGSKALALDNDRANKPFGNIDTPTQGGTVDSNIYPNFGWAMTQAGKCIDTAGTTAYEVYIDGIKRTLRPTGTTANWFPGLSRADLQAGFAGLCNASNGLAAFYIDVGELGLATGVHTIGWIVTDNAGKAEGIGSRFFNVLVGSTSVTAAPIFAAESRRAGPTSYVRAAEPTLPLPARVRAFTGFGKESLRAPDIDADGNPVVEMPSAGRLVLDFDGPIAEGHELVGDETRPLPAGSSFDRDAGRFAWQPPVGFLGSFRLVFAAGREHVTVSVRIR